MKNRFVAALLLAALFVVPTVARAEYVRMWKYDAPCWDFTVDSCSSTGANLTTTGGSTLTSLAVRTDGWIWQSYAVNTTAFVPIRLFFLATGRTGTGADSIYYAVDWSPDGSTWTEGLTLTGATTVTEGDLALSVPITVDADAANGNVFAAPYLRVRMQGDVASGHAWVAMKVYVGHEEWINR